MFGRAVRRTIRTIEVSTPMPMPNCTPSRRVPIKAVHHATKSAVAQEESGKRVVRNEGGKGVREEERGWLTRLDLIEEPRLIEVE